VTVAKPAEIVTSVIETDVDLSAPALEEMVTTRSTPVMRSRVYGLLLSATFEGCTSTSVDCNCGFTAAALAGVARPVTPIRVTKVAAIARTKTEERLALTITDVFSMRAGYESNVYLNHDLDKE
jgi:hypothetical protein